MARIVNDVHSRLNEARVAEIDRPKSLAELQRSIAHASRTGLEVAVCGGRHAMGGQQFRAGGLLVDTSALDLVLAFDREAGTLDVEAGIQWPALLTYLHGAQAGAAAPWAFRQKQTGADRLSIGGAIAANAHGRGLTFPPFVADVESLTLVTADGDLVTCSRQENRGLFSLVVGGYGLLGVVYSARLRLVPRRVLERVVEVRSADGLVDAFEERVAEGFLYGDFQFSIDPRDSEFLRRGVFSCYRPTDATMTDAPRRALTTDDWRKLLYLAHTDKAEAWRRYSEHYLATSGQLYLSDSHQLAEYLDGYHAWLDEVTRAEHPATEMITELYVPRHRLVDFLTEAADDFRAHGVDVVYGTIRLIEQDDETVLAWARERWTCVIFNVHTVHTPDGLRHAVESFRRLIDLAARRGGSYFLTYHRWARRDQIEACHPRLRELVAEKRRFDPEERFASDWYRHHVELLEL